MAKIVDFNEKRKEFEELKNNQNAEVKPIAESVNDFIKCQACGNAKFNQVFVLKIMTPLDDPNLMQNAVMPIPVFECNKCGKMAKVYV